ncbi:MAG: hypothetical protein OEY96_12245 [Gammaproteobacteria bacterium]|nr:hypothetical protein [Gammaproteobacteria bacterium]
MSKEYLAFEDLDEHTKEWLLQETWCDQCEKPDLGMTEPVMYVENGKTYVEGKCSICSVSQKSQIITKEFDE